MIDADRRAGRPPLRFAMVYPFATHNYELRYWLAAAGIDPDNDLVLTVVPPPRMVEALERARRSTASASASRGTPPPCSAAWGASP